MLFRIGSLPEEALAASTAFHSGILSKLESELESGAGHLTLVFDPAGDDHRGWRLAVVQELARKFAPVRVNAVVSGDETAIAAAEAYCAKAPGLTGQILVLDANGAKGLLSKE